MIKFIQVLVVQPIFIPNEAMLKKNLDSLKTLKNIMTTGYGITIRLGGWAADGKLWGEFISEVNKIPLKISDIKRFDKNYGKAWIVNNLTTDIDKFHYLFTFDSDIKFIPEQNYIDRLMEVAKYPNEIFNKPFGVLSLNQKESNCHIMGHLKIKKDWRDETFYWNAGYNYK